MPLAMAMITSGEEGDGGQRDWPSYLRITKSIRPHQTIAGFPPNLSRKIGLRSAVMQVADSRSVKGDLYH